MTAQALPAAVASLFWTHHTAQPAHQLRLTRTTLLAHPEATPQDISLSQLQQRALASGACCIHCRQPLSRQGHPVPICHDWHYDPVRNNRTSLTATRGWACSFPCALRAALAQTSQRTKAMHAMHCLAATTKTFPTQVQLPPMDPHSAESTRAHNVRTHVMEYDISGKTVTQRQPLDRPTPAHTDAGPSPIFSPAPDRHALAPFGGPLRTNATDVCFTQRALDAPPLVRAVTCNQVQPLLEGSLPVYNEFETNHECVIRHPKLSAPEPWTPHRQQDWVGVCCLHCTHRIKEAASVWPVLSAAVSPAHIGVESAQPYVFTALPGAVCSPACHRAYVNQELSLATASAAKTAMALFVRARLGPSFDLAVAPAMCDLRLFGGEQTSTAVPLLQNTDNVYVASVCYHVTPSHCPPSVVHKVATQAMQTTHATVTRPVTRQPKGTSIAEKQAQRLTLANKRAQARAKQIPIMVQIPEGEEDEEQ